MLASDYQSRTTIICEFFCGRTCPWNWAGRQLRRLKGNNKNRIGKDTYQTRRERRPAWAHGLCCQALPWEQATGAWPKSHWWAREQSSTGGDILVALKATQTLCPLETGVDKDHDAGGKKLSRGRQTGEPGREGRQASWPWRGDVVAAGGELRRWSAMKTEEILAECRLTGQNSQINPDAQPQRPDSSTAAAQVEHTSMASIAPILGAGAPEELDQGVHGRSSTTTSTGFAQPHPRRAWRLERQRTKISASLLFPATPLNPGSSPASGEGRWGGKARRELLFAAAKRPVNSSEFMVSIWWGFF